MKRLFVSGLLAVLAASGCGFDTPVPPESSGGSGGSGSGGSGGSGQAGGSGAGGSSGGGSAGAGSPGAAGSQGGAGGSGGGNGSPDGGTAAENPIPTKDPMLLSETGLYSDIKTGKLGAGVFPFKPQYPLWSDASEKKRWIALPPGKKIDTFKMDFWDYPSGTRFWKEFVRDGKRVETRLLLKRSPGVWFAMAYKWNNELTEATAVPKGETNASGTPHDIPSQEACSQCHSPMQDWALGFSALQLSHNLGEGLNLDDIKAKGWLSDPPAGPITLPGDATAKAALGYLHGNCGNCHNEGSKPYGIGSDVDLWAHADLLSTVETTRAYLSMVCATWKKENPITTCPTGMATGTPKHSELTQLKRITPGNASMSAIHELMSLRESTAMAMRQMPPVGSEVADNAGLKAVADWINKLPPR